MPSDFTLGIGFLRPQHYTPFVITHVVLFLSIIVPVARVPGIPLPPQAPEKAGDAQCLR
ncbi:hypothetical protein B9Z19DRAFT_1092162 [Tuber borchii]|uniref:Uncharacterized protein n=1 Tax=Tuber borchii TaxID=42251 RepID=A0A2T6ZGS5_TUBBO|nr:hypothetical protein B9Z19DRAFT_1092162 [Tuber borchii]